LQQRFVKGRTPTEFSPMDDSSLYPFLRKVKQLAQNETFQSFLLGSVGCVAFSFAVHYCDTEEVDFYNKSVITTIKEVEHDQFRITDEQILDEKGKTLANIFYLDGKQEQIPFDSLWIRIDEHRPLFSYYSSADNSLTEVMAYSAVGSMLSYNRRKTLYSFYHTPDMEDNEYRHRFIRYYIDEALSQHSLHIRSTIDQHVSTRNVSRGFFGNSHSHGHTRG
jgi:hypothetical protein